MIACLTGQDGALHRIVDTYRRHPDDAASFARALGEAGCGRLWLILVAYERAFATVRRGLATDALSITGVGFDGKGDLWRAHGRLGIFDQLAVAPKADIVAPNVGAADCGRYQDPTYLHFDEKGPDVLHGMPTEEALASPHQVVRTMTAIPGAAVCLKPRAVCDEVVLNLAGKHHPLGLHCGGNEHDGRSDGQACLDVWAIGCSLEAKYKKKTRVSSATRAAVPKPPPSRRVVGVTHIVAAVDPEMDAEDDDEDEVVGVDDQFEHEANPGDAAGDDPNEAADPDEARADVFADQQPDAEVGGGTSHS